MKLALSELFVGVALFLLIGVATGAEPRADALALQSLAAVDSLLAANRIEEAVAASRGFQSDFQGDLHWSIQFDGRLAVALLRADLLEEALPLLEQQVIANPGQASGHRNLGACLLGLGRRGRALSEYQQVVELDPRNASARMEYGQILLDFRMYRDAGEEILTAASLCGDCMEIQSVLARYYMAVNQPGKAVPHWDIVWNETGHPVARQNLLKALLDSGQDVAALDLLQKNLITGLSRVELQQMMAAEGRLGQSEQSLLFVRMLDERNSAEKIPGIVAEDPVFWGQISLNLLVEEKYPDALLAVNRAVALSPENVVFRNNRVVLLQKLGRYEEADREWEKVLLLDPSLKGK